MLSSTFAQTSYHVTTGQGLSTNQLTILIKDKQNNMWFGSYNGLHKHEGTSIKVYKKNSTDSTSLSSNEMHAVFEDRLGYIWVGTTGGLDRLDPKTEIIKHFKLRSAKRTDNWIGYILSIFQDNKDNIWVVTEAGLFIVDYKTGKYTEVLEVEKSGKGVPNSLTLYKSSIKTSEGIWMFATGYMIYYEFKTGKFFHQYNNPAHKNIFNLRKDSDAFGRSELCSDFLYNLYFIYKNEMLIKYNTVTDKLDSFRFEFPKNAWRCCFSITSDYKGNIWIGFRYGGLLFFNKDTHKFTPIRYTNTNSLIQSDYIYSLQEDYLKRMWVTTNNGIFIINYYDSIVHQEYLNSSKNALNIDYPSAIISQDSSSNIYVPFGLGGLFKYNINSGNSKYFPIRDTAIKKYGYVYTDENRQPYISSMGTLFSADILVGKIKNIHGAGKMGVLLKKEAAAIEWIYTYSKNAVYIKKENGYIYYYNGTDSLVKIEVKGYSKQACVSYDRLNLYFLNTNSDLVKRNFTTLKMDTFVVAAKLQALNFSYSNNRDIADDGNGNIWISSQNGLVKYNLEKKDITVYTTANGLLHDFSFTLCVDTKKRLWVGTMGGINVYDEHNNTFINVFSEAPDKLSNYFGSSLEAKDGHLYFLFGSKLVDINPDAFFKKKREERTLKLNEVQINRSDLTFCKNDLQNLSYQQNRIYFRFGLLEFVDPDKVKYYYQLQGLDNKWVDLGNHTEVTFNSLQPGNYTLHVKATDASGNEVKEQLSISFTIKPPFWKTWWFILLILFCIALLIFKFIKWREKNIKSIEAEKLKVQELNAAQYKSKLELEQIINYFSSSLIDKHTVDAVLWDVAKNLIGQLGFVDCMIYLWNADKTKMLQRAGHGPKDTAEEINAQAFDVAIGQGVVGYVMQTKEAVLIADTSKDARYRPDDIVRLSEITVPIIYDNELIGVLDSEHPDKDFYTEKHLQILTTIAALVGNKIKSIEAEENLQTSKIEIYKMEVLLAKAKLEALRSQMNPHFIFNSLNAIQECIVTGNIDAAYEYLSKFSKLQRLVLNNSAKELIPLGTEIEMLQLYLSLESLRFSKSFTYKIDIDKTIDKEEILIPSLITQPYVENSIWHGLRNIESEKRLAIDFKEADGNLIITIDDNGIGRAEAGNIKFSKIAVNKYKSMGSILSADRISLLNKQYKTTITLSYTDKKDTKGNAIGTTVTISLPNNLSIS